MRINQADMDELKRISTNTYSNDKSCMIRIIRGIGALNNDIRTLTIEKARLEKELAQVKANGDN